MEHRAEPAFACAKRRVAEQGSELGPQRLHHVLLEDEAVRSERAGMIVS